MVVIHMFILIQHQVQVTPTDNSYWDVLTTGYNNTGGFIHTAGQTAYETGDKLDMVVTHMLLKRKSYKSISSKSKRYKNTSY